MGIIRWILGKVILAAERAFPPASVQRDAAAQAKADALFAQHALYQFEACPFCVKVRRAAKRMNLKIPLRDAQRGPYRDELVREGGQAQVPCLKIPSGDGKATWLYESSDIIAYLERELATLGI